MEHPGFIASVEQSIVEHWSRPAFSDYKDNPVTYGEVGRRIAKLHILYEHCGIKKNDHIAICSRNCTSWAIAYFSVLTYGAVAVPLLHEFKPKNVEHLVNHSEAKFLIVGDVVWEGIEDGNLNEVNAVLQMQNFELVYCKDDRYRNAYNNLDKLFKEKYPDGFTPNDVKYEREDPESLALINYTSGTTSMSKGVMLPYRALVGNLIFAKRDLPGLNQYSNTISMLPMAHMYAMTFDLLYEFMVGAHIHFLTRIPSPKIIAEAFSSIKPDIIISVPLIIEKIVKTKFKPILDKKYVKQLLSTPYINTLLLKRIQKDLCKVFGEKFYEIIIGGAAINKDLEKFLHKVNFPYTVGYGMTECAPIICYCDYKSAKLHSCGKVVEELELKIDSPDPYNIPGEIMVKGMNVMTGYYKNEHATNEVLVDGWLHTGDLAVIDKDGYVFIKGRIKNMILSSNGQNIYPEEIENKLNFNDLVNESLVFEREGKIIALVNLMEDKVPLDGLDRNSIENILEKIRKETNEELPKYEQIHKLYLQPEEFERTPKRSIKRYMYTHK